MRGSHGLYFRSVGVFCRARLTVCMSLRDSCLLPRYCRPLLLLPNRGFLRRTSGHLCSSASRSACAYRPGSLLKRQDFRFQPVKHIQKFQKNTLSDVIQSAAQSDAILPSFMLQPLAVFLIGASFAVAQTPSVAGFWKADLQQSKIPGPPLKDYAEIINVSGKQITEKIGMVGPRGESRSELVYNTEKPTIRPYEGVPSRETVTLTGSALTVTIDTDGRAQVVTRHYELSPDSKNLTITGDVSGIPHPQHSVIVLTKAAESDLAWLTKPEALASEQFKNVKTQLKTLPASEFIDQMHYFAWALDKDCEFCHVHGHFDSDDKKEKRTARDMIALVSNVNSKYFEDKPEVKCFTCHEFHGHPLSRPLFPGEPEHHHGSENGQQPGDHEHPPSDSNTK